MINPAILRGKRLYRPSTGTYTKELKIPLDWTHSFSSISTKTRATPKVDRGWDSLFKRVLSSISPVEWIQIKRLTALFINYIWILLCGTIVSRSFVNLFYASRTFSMVSLWGKQMYLNLISFDVWVFRVKKVECSINITNAHAPIDIDEAGNSNLVQCRTDLSDNTFCFYFHLVRYWQIKKLIIMLLSNCTSSSCSFAANWYLQHLAFLWYHCPIELNCL